MDEYLPLVGIYSTDAVIDIFKELVDPQYRLMYIRKGLVAPMTEFWKEYYNNINKSLGKLLYEKVGKEWQLSYPIPIHKLVKNWLIDIHGRLQAKTGASKWKHIPIEANLVMLSSTTHGVFVVSELSDIWFIDNAFTVYGIQPYNNIVEIKAIEKECYILNRDGIVSIFSPFKESSIFYLPISETIYGLNKENGLVEMLPKNGHNKRYFWKYNKLIIRKEKYKSIMKKGNEKNKYAVVPQLVSEHFISAKPMVYKITSPIIPMTYDIDFDNDGIPRDPENSFDMNAEYEQMTVDMLRDAEDVGNGLLAYTYGSYPIF